jgi:capsid portal protein
MFVHVPGGDENAIRIMPIGDKATADDFPAMKRVSQDDIFAAWRIPAELAGVAPTYKRGRGDAIKAAKVFVEMEIFPLLPLFESLNNDLHPSFRFKFDTPETGVFSALD